MKTHLLSLASTFSISSKHLLVAVAVFCTFLTTARAQDDLDPAAEEAPKGGLNVDSLIGNAVSSTKGKYPEIEKAIQRFRNGDGPGAMDYLNQAKDKHSKLPPVDIMMAKLQLAARNGQAVRGLLERAASENPEDPEAFLMLADQAFVGGRITEALALFDYAAPIVDDFSGNKFRKEKFEIRVIAGRSAVAERRKQWDNAKELLEEWLRMDPDSAAAYQRLGVVQFNLKESREALKNFRKAKELDPEKVVHPFVIMARLFAQQEDSLNAKKAFERAYNDDRSDAKVAQAYAEWLIQEDELKEAQEVASTLRDQAPESVTALLLNGIVTLMQGQREQAQEALVSVLGVDPSHAAAINILALLLIDSEDSADQKRALQYAQMNAQRFPDSGQANVTYGWVLYKLKKGREAETALGKGLKAGNLPANSRYLLARIASEQEQQKEKAVAELERLLNNNQGLFLFRKEAEALLAKLKTEMGLE